MKWLRRVGFAAYVALLVIVIGGFCLSMIGIWVAINVVAWLHTPWPFALAITFIQAFFTLLGVAVVAES